MPSLMFGTISQGDIPRDENTVRANTYPVSQDDPPAVEPHVPEFESIDSDGNPNLGMVTRQLAPYYIPGTKYAPFWADAVDQSSDHNDKINRQVSSSGTAARREESGQFGHGTMPIAIGIEPVQGLREGGQYGNDYFISHPKDVQSTMNRDLGVQPPPNDGMSRDAIMSDSEYGKAASRQAYQANYSDWYRAVIG